MLVNVLCFFGGAVFGALVFLLWALFVYSANSVPKHGDWTE